MKKILFFSAILVTLVSNSFASGNTSNKAETHLQTHYAGAKDVVWTLSDDFEKASFTLGNEKMEVYYDEFGNLMGSTKSIAFDKLPKSALDFLTREYTFPEYQLTDCIEYTDADDNSSFFVSFDYNNERILVSVSSNGAVSLM